MERSAGERRSSVPFLEPSEDPAALDPFPVAQDDVVRMPEGAFPAPRDPWYEVPPGGYGPRFLEGVPNPCFNIDPAYHVKLAARAHTERYEAGLFNGNTGFRSNGPYETGDLSESAKTGLTGAFLLGALGLVFVIYSKPSRA
jgi:hypothetical protein